MILYNKILNILKIIRIKNKNLILNYGIYVPIRINRDSLTSKVTYIFKLPKILHLLND